MAPYKVAIIGSGNWGSAIAKIVGENVLKNKDTFDPTVREWVFEETVDGEKLTNIINTKHENVKYLPGVKLPESIVADPDLLSTVKDANALVFVVPHQFIHKVCDQLKGHIRKDAIAISLIKGVEVKSDKIEIFADVIHDKLGIPCSALSGANIANEVGKGAFSETTIGYPPGRAKDGEVWYKLFNTPNFRVSLVDDVAGVSMAGAIKNVVAIAAGLSDGLGWGNNAKAAIIRIGLLEMSKFTKEFFDNVKDATFVAESAGIADLITTCFGGRNRKVAEAYAQNHGKKSFPELEKELLNGQKLQGTETAKEIHEFLKNKGKVDDYPLFKVVYDVAYGGLDPEKLTSKI